MKVRAKKLEEERVKSPQKVFLTNRILDEL